MRKRVLLQVMVCLLLTVSGYAQGMSDTEVIQYVQEARQQGKSKEFIYTELTARGVSREQMERIGKSYQAASGDMSVEEVDAVGVGNTDIRQRSLTLSGTQDSMQVVNGQLTTATAERSVFGRNIFNTKNLTFEPNMNMATPANYQLGPGDEVIIDIWGANQASIRKVISPDGTIFVNNLGLVYLNGKNIEQANAYLQKEFARIYADVDGTAPATQIKLTLGQIRTIQVNVMGEVVTPGTYALSSFATVFHALYSAGGVNDIGTLRNIRVMRGSECVAEMDVYKYILDGKMSDDVRLMDGDVILVPTYDKLVEIAGKVKRPMLYEMKEGETLATLVDYAGGFTGDSYSKNLRMVRRSGRELQVYNVDDTDFASFPIMDGDVVTVDAILDRYENRVEIKGAIYRPGMYQLGDQVGTIRQLVEKAEGLRGDAFLNRAILQREREDYTHEIISLDMRGIMAGSVADVNLQKNDVIYIPSIHDLQEVQNVVIWGEVAKPGLYPYSDNTTLEDLIIQAGGLLESASTVRVDVARRIKDPASMTESDTISETYSFALKDGFVIDGEPGFVLQPFDEVYVRRSPGYMPQRNVVIEGEVLFGGTYALQEKNERLSDLVQKAGGVTSNAYVTGARLIRKMNDEEKAIRDASLKVAQQGGKDSVALSSLDIADYYSVGIELEQALANPGSDYDLVLREGDRLIVPEYSNTVKINGAVLYPNTVAYKADERLRYYIGQGGGYSSQAKRNKIYVVYMNGTVARGRKCNRKLIQPGCQIIVPTKSDRRKLSAAEILSIGSSAASLATMGATITNLLQK